MPNNDSNNNNNNNNSNNYIVPYVKLQKCWSQSSSIEQVLSLGDMWQAGIGIEVETSFHGNFCYIFCSSLIWYKIVKWFLTALLVNDFCGFVIFRLSWFYCRHADRFSGVVPFHNS